MNGDIEARALPHHLEAERAVLGAVLVDNAVLHEVIDVLTEADFYRDAHRRLFKHMVSLSAAQSPIDLVTLTTSLGRTGELDEVNGPAYIAALLDGVPRSTNASHYAQIVREKARLRQVIFAANKILATAYDAEEDARVVVDQAERLLFEIAAGERAGGFVPAATSVAKTFEAIERWRQARNGVIGVPTGFRDLDDLTSGLQPGHLILLAARPGQGKSALAGQIALNVARSTGPVGIFTLEMEDVELVVRHVAGLARVDARRLQHGYLSEAEWTRVAAALGEVANARLFIDESPAVNALEIRARARRLKAEQNGLALIVVDYLQLMDTDTHAENRNIGVSVISRGFKVLAKELHAPVLVLSQLNRGPELRTNHRPMLADLRDSGTLEQDANLVMFLYRDEVYHDVTDENRGVAELIFAKHRGGPLGTIRLRWTAEETRFDTYDDPRAPRDGKQLQLAQEDR